MRLAGSSARLQTAVIIHLNYFQLLSEKDISSALTLGEWLITGDSFTTTEKNTVNWKNYKKGGNPTSLFNAVFPSILIVHQFSHSNTHPLHLIHSYMNTCTHHITLLTSWEGSGSSYASISCTLSGWGLGWWFGAGVPWFLTLGGVTQGFVIPLASMGVGM